MYQYSRAIYRSIKDLVDPWAEPEKQVEYRREVLAACEETVERLAKDPRYFAHPDRVPGAGRLGRDRGDRRRGRVHRGPDRGRSVRRRDRALPRDHAQGQAVP